jgi:hypothetical protein
MYLNFSAYPMIVDTEYSYNNEYFPWQDPFDQTYLVDLHTALPDQSLESFLDYSYLQHIESSVGFPSGLDSCPAFRLAPLLGELGRSSVSSFDRHPIFDLGTPITPSTSLFSTLPLCADEISALASCTLLPSSLECETLKEATLSGKEPVPKQPQRKCGRPRLERKLAGIAPIFSVNSLSSKHCQHTPCQLHKRAERKYRNGLDSDLEKLRRAVPTLLQSKMIAL